MNAARLAERLRGSRCGRVVRVFDTVDSTNQRAMEDLRANEAPDGTVYAARRQTAGRGSSGRAWHSEDDGGLLFTVALTEPPGASPVSFWPGVAAVDVLRETCGVSAHLKWPNDVLVGERKLGGILIETLSAPDCGPAHAVGMGLNVNQRSFPAPVADTAVSVALLTGRDHDLEELLFRVLEAMNRLDARGEDLVDAWVARSRMIGRRVRFRRRGGEAWARVVGLTPEGFLEVVDDQGRPRTWVSRADLDLG